MPDAQQPASNLPPDAPWWARWLVADIRDAWKWAALWWPVFMAAGAEVYAQYRDQINQLVEAAVPPPWRPHLLACGCVVCIVLRVINLTKQKGTP